MSLVDEVARKVSENQTSVSHEEERVAIYLSRMSQLSQRMQIAPTSRRRVHLSQEKRYGLPSYEHKGLF